MAKHKSFKAAFAILLVTASLAATAQQKKVALVIGAQNYTSLSPLRNSLADARDLTATLKAKGFQVETLLDPKTNREIKDAIIRYKITMQDQVGGVGIIFYAGHGMQFEGNNYLIPTAAKLELSSDLDDQCLKMNSVMAALNASNKSLNILLLDACRSIPSFNRDSEQGWTKVSAPRGSIIVFATEAGKVASDGNGKNGLFTSKLLKQMNQPGLNIMEVFKRVKQDVFAESGERQLPSVEDNSIGGDFYFSGSAITTAATPIYTAPVKQAETANVAVRSEPVNKPFDYGYGSADASTVTVGSQRWLGKNLNVDRFANGDPIPQAQTEDEWKRANAQQQPAWCYYNNDPANGRTYGKLYNWYAVHDARGLAPAGWHVPSDAEWTQLTGYLGGEAIAGKKMKSVSLWAENGNGSNSSGIAGLPGGNRYTSGSFRNIGKDGYWWSSSEDAPVRAWVRGLDYNSGKAGRAMTTRVAVFLCGASGIDLFDYLTICFLTPPPEAGKFFLRNGLALRFTCLQSLLRFAVGDISIH